MAVVDLKPTLGTLSMRLDYTLVQCVHSDAHSHLEVSVSLTIMFLGGGRKLENLEETPVLPTFYHIKDIREVTA